MSLSLIAATILKDPTSKILRNDAVFEDGGYVAKVRAEQVRLDQVAAGVNVPVQ